MIQAVKYFGLIILALTFAALFPATLVTAQGLGLTGNFYSVTFTLAPGESSYGIDAYIIVINTGTEPLRVVLSTEAPPGVMLETPESDFVLEVGGKKRIDILVKVGVDAQPGEYSLGISAIPYKTGSGIQILAGGSQQAKLKILSNPSNTLPIIAGAAGGVAVLALIAFLIMKHRSKPKKVYVK